MANRKSPEQDAREILERMDVAGAQGFGERTLEELASTISAARLGSQLTEILLPHAGERGDSEGAVECLQRILRERGPVAAGYTEMIGLRPEAEGNGWEAVRTGEPASCEIGQGPQPSDALRDLARKHELKQRPQDDTRSMGLYGKYRIERLDGTDLPGGKHEGCEYFVLDITHDRHAAPALYAYAESARRDGYRPLADELRDKAFELIIRTVRAEEAKRIEAETRQAFSGAMHEVDHATRLTEHATRTERERNGTPAVDG